jgi:excisionase family DNA binding protein
MKTPTQSNPRSRMLKPSTIARRLDVTMSTVRRWIHEGSLRAVDVRVKRGRATYRVTVANFESFLLARGMSADEARELSAP